MLSLTMLMGVCLFVALTSAPSIVDVLNNVLGRLSRLETGLSRLQSGHTNALSRLRQLETGNTNVVSRLTRLQADITQLRNAPSKNYSVYLLLV